MVPEVVKFALFCTSDLPRVQKSANYMPKGAILRKGVQKVLFNRNSFFMMQFS